MTRIILFTALVLALAAGSAGAASASGKNGFLKTSDGKIYCGWGYGSGSSFVVCGLKKGFLKPKPKNNCAKQGVDYVGNRIAFTGTSKAKVQQCAGDAGPFADPKATKVLPNGKTWTGGGMSCTSKATGMTCKNKKKHGFTMNKTGTYHLF